MKLILVVDGGTTNLRVTAVDASTHEVLANAKAAGGVKHTAVDGNNLRLKQLLRECIESVLTQTGCTEEEVLRCIAFGMITSNMGLLEIPHLIAPVSLQDLHDGMQTSVFPEIASFPIEFIPGVRNLSGVVNAENCGQMDMMRGEEVEAIGLYQLAKPSCASVFVLPGSHNKLIRMSTDGKIMACMTSISGELLDVISHYTILSDAVQHSFCSAENYDAKMTIDGAKACAVTGLGRAAFSGRILNTLGKLPAASVQSWLLGAVLAEDAKAAEAFTVGEQDSTIYVAGKPPLQQAFCDVLETLTDMTTISVKPEESAQMGLVGALMIAGC